MIPTGEIWSLDHSCDDRHPTGIHCECGCLAFHRRGYCRGGDASARRDSSGRILRRAAIWSHRGRCLCARTRQISLARWMALRLTNPDAGVTATVREVITRQDVLATTLVWRFEWILAAYVLVVFFCVARDRFAPGRRGFGSRPASAPPPLASMPASTVSSAFASPAYPSAASNSVDSRPCSGWDIYYVADAARDRCVRLFIFGKGTACSVAEPVGESLLSVQPEKGGWRLSTSYVVADASTGAVLGILEPAGSGLDGPRPGPPSCRPRRGCRCASRLLQLLHARGQG